MEYGLSRKLGVGSVVFFVFFVLGMGGEGVFLFIKSLDVSFHIKLEKGHFERTK